MRITENNLTSNNHQTGNGLLEQILSPTNLNAAFKQLRRNKGSGGVDRMDVGSLKDYLVREKEELITSIERGKYRPNPVRRVAIPKENGKRRELGIPTVLDRVIQQSIAQELSRLYEPEFSPQSFGFRPKRDAHQALCKCRDYITEGYIYAVDIDLERFFDTVNHSKLIEVLSRKVKDGRVVSPIHKYLSAGVMKEGKYEDTPEGVPQGGPLSPVLSNILLIELDREIERRGHKFVRYADDMVILCRSLRSAERTMQNIIPFIEGKLLLKVNRDKSKAAHVREVKFLGYSFYIIKGEGICFYSGGNDIRTTYIMSRKCIFDICQHIIRSIIIAYCRRSFAEFCTLWQNNISRRVYLYKGGIGIEHSRIHFSIFKPCLILCYII